MEAELLKELIEVLESINLTLGIGFLSVVISFAALVIKRG